jgi:signal transduction histidine kinase
MNPLRSVGARLSLALVVVVALALALVYAIVVPSLRNRLVDSKLTQLKAALPEIRSQMATTKEFAWEDKLPVWESRASGARVALYSVNQQGVPGRKPSLLVQADSNPVNSSELTSDRIAQEAAAKLIEVAGTVHRGDQEYAEVAEPVSTTVTPAFSGVLLLSAPLDDALANVHTVQRRLLEAGLLALLLAMIVGHGAAWVFARRIRRLEAAAEEIAAGRFDEPIVDPHEDELGQLARAFDRMRLRLSQLERARREFVGNASHELRTPLFSLRGFIELLTDEELDEPTRREFLETMREQVDRLQRLAEDLLDLTRLDAGRIHIERRRVDLAEVADDLGEEFRAVALATGHPLEIDAEGSAALGDEERILRIGRALVENALKHTPAGTQVRVVAGPGTLAVEDDGPGIPAEHVEHVFERFYRVDGTRASGSGLGLAIAHELAEAMGGTLELATGAGSTTFTLHLPAPPEPAPIPRENVPARV